MRYVECSCSKRVAANAKRFHERGKAHQEWVEENGDASYIDVDELILPELEEALKLSDPVDVARAVRKIFNVQRWPNKLHPDNVRDFLEQHGIPIFDTPHGANDKNVHKSMFTWRAEHPLS